MATYIMLSRLTETGAETLKKSPGRILEVNKELSQMGVKVLQQYAVLGAYDFVNIVEAPDMATVSQELTDGELFYVIEHGIRFTGMPAWGTGTPAGEEASWHLVHFIRHLPQTTPEEIEQMEAMNPRSPADIRQEIEAERFLRGDDPAPTEPPQPHGH